MTSLEFRSRKQTFLSELSTLRRNADRAAERKRQAEKTGNAPSQEADEEEKLPWFKNYGAVITRYLQQVHSIETMKGFAKKLNVANSHHDTVEKDLNLSFRTLDSIVKSCEKWRCYLEDQESFYLLVCLEAISMAKIHASVIAARNFYERQGSLGVRLKSDACIPPLFTTVVSYHGMVQVFS